MSGKGGGGQKAGIPPASRKMVQSLKEIVSNIPEHEIYATLKDCNMDPNEAVSRLLSQGITLHCTALGFFNFYHNHSFARA